MANTATLVGTIPGGLRLQGLGCATRLYHVVFDTIDSDLTVMTPATGRYWAITGLVYKDGSAHTFTIKSGSSTILALEQTTFGGVQHPLGSGIFAAGGNAAEALVLRCGTAVITSMLLYVQEFEALDFNKG